MAKKKAPSLHGQVRPLWQAPTTNPKNGNIIKGFFYARLSGRKVSLKTDDEGQAWETLRKLQGNNPEAANPTVGSLVNLRLASAKRDHEPDTYKKTLQTLWDFATGFSVSLVDPDSPTNGPKIGDGYGNVLVIDFKPYHVQKWLDGHKDWNRSTRCHRYNTVKGVFVEAKRLGLITANPLDGYRVPGITKRVSYFDPETEALIYANVSKHLRDLLWLCIETGMRPFSEAAKLTADHVEDDGQRMRFKFATHKTKKKTGKTRYVYPNPAVATFVRSRMELYPRGSGLPLVQTSRKKKWKGTTANNQFGKMAEKIGLARRLRAKFGSDMSEPVIYSCRHTFATRMIPKVGLAKTAALMGNTIKVCQDTYGHLDCLHEDLYEAAAGR